jgi:hypothetical protein
MAAWWVRIDLLQNYFAIRNVCLRRWQIILTGFSAESNITPDPLAAGRLGRRAVGRRAKGFLWRRSGQAEESVKDEAARYRQRNENIALVSLSS